MHKLARLHILTRRVDRAGAVARLSRAGCVGGWRVGASCRRVVTLGAWVAVRWLGLARPHWFTALSCPRLARRRLRCQHCSAVSGWRYAGLRRWTDGMLQEKRLLVEARALFFLLTRVAPLRGDQSRGVGCTREG